MRAIECGTATVLVLDVEGSSVPSSHPRPPAMMHDAHACSPAAVEQSRVD